MTKTPTIFLLEDDRFDVEVLLRAFKKRKYDVKIDVAANGQLAVELLDNLVADDGACDRPVLSILDINVPLLTGFEVCKLIKSHKNLRDIPVLFFSGSSSQQDKTTAIEVGGSAFYNKNDGPEALVEYVCELLSTSK